jgi:hypothetical protein
MNTHSDDLRREFESAFDYGPDFPHPALLARISENLKGGAKSRGQLDWTARAVATAMALLLVLTLIGFERFGFPNIRSAASPARTTPSMTTTPSIQPSPAPAAPGTTRYTVTAMLLSVKGGPVKACLFALASSPPAGCNGPEVRGVDIRKVPGAQLYGQGTDATVVVEMVKLVGIWKDLGLTVTEPPIRSKLSEATPAKYDCPDDGLMSQVQASAIATALHSDPTLKANGIQLLDAQPCAHTVRVLLAVADTHDIEYLTERYGKLHISGWLQLASQV